MATIVEPETTAEVDLGVLPEDALYEVIHGQVVEKVMGTYSTEIASLLHEYLAPFLRREKLGRSIIELMIRFDSETQFRPDLAFFSREKWPLNLRTPDGAWNVIPDLTVEVVSETDRAGHVLDKTLGYFRAGVRSVWLIYPHSEVIHVYHSFDRISVLTKADVLDGGEVIPGFRLPLATLFEGQAPASSPSD